MGCLLGLAVATMIAANLSDPIGHLISKLLVSLGLYAKIVVCIKIIKETIEFVRIYGKNLL